MMVMNVAGYQPSRYRYVDRQPNFGEVRSQAYLGILFGAKGLEFYNFDKGSPDTNVSFEPANSAYNLEDPYSVEHYDNLITVADDLYSHKEIFLAHFAEDLSVSTDNENVFCNVWDVSGNHKMICVNADQRSSDHFEGVSGSVVYDPRIYVDVEGEKVFPEPEEYESSGYVYSKFLKEDLAVAVKKVYTGVTDQVYTFDEFNMTFYEAPKGSSVKFAVYEDTFRDECPDVLLYESEEILIETDSEINFTFYLDEPITLEHTTLYYILVKTDSEDVEIPVRDVRRGVRVRDDPDVGGYQPIFEDFPLLESFSKLHVGRVSEVSISFSDLLYERYCVERELSGGCVLEQFDGISIEESFEPYAVHIYHLGYSEEIFCGDGTCNGGESCSSCPADCGMCNGPGDPDDPSVDYDACNDGLDNDLDGFVDYPEDPGCDSFSDDSELDSNQSAGQGDCEELWDCGSWGECVDGLERRECFDLHECGTVENKPLTEEACRSSSNLSGFRYDVLFAGILASVGLIGIVVLILRLLKTGGKIDKV